MLDDAAAAERALTEIGKLEGRLKGLESAQGELGRRMLAVSQELNAAQVEEAKAAVAEADVALSATMHELLVVCESWEACLAKAGMMQQRVLELQGQYPGQAGWLSPWSGMPVNQAWNGFHNWLYLVFDLVSEKLPKPRSAEDEAIHQRLWQVFYGEQSRQNIAEDARRKAAEAATWHTMR